MDYITVTSLTDPIERRIPVGEASEVAFRSYEVSSVEGLMLGGPSAEEMLCKDIGAALKAMLERDFPLDGMKPGRIRPVHELEFEPRAKPESDPNAAMLARDEPARGAVSALTRADVWLTDTGFTYSVEWPFGAKSTAKPAIHGITTVHDGRPRGIGFCDDRD